MGTEVGYVKPRHIYLSMGLVLAVSYASLALMDADPPGNNTVQVGYFIGSLYAHASLAAAWSALGPCKVTFRLPLSLLWVLALPVAIAVTVELHGGPISVTLMLGACLFGQWLMIQAVLLVLVWRIGLRIGHPSDILQAEGRSVNQFRILDLLALITASAILFAVGRALVPLRNLSGEAPSFIFLAIAAVLLTLPLLLSALLERFAIRAVICSLLYLGIATYFEISIMESINVSGPTMGHFVAINISSALLIVIIVALLRANGFRLYIRAKTIAG